MSRRVRVAIAATIVLGLGLGGGCRTIGGGDDATAAPAAATAEPRTAGAIRRPVTLPPVRASGLSGVRVFPVIRSPNGALLLTLSPEDRRAALTGAPAAVGTLEHPAEGMDPAVLLQRYFRDTARGLHARLRISERDVDRRLEGRDATAEGFRYRIDLQVTAADDPQVVLFAERGEGEATWSQPLEADGDRWIQRREEALPRLARLAFQAALTDLQDRVGRRRDELMAAGRSVRPAPAPEPPVTR